MAKKYKENKADVSGTLLYGKILPQAVELEEAVLGAAMLDIDALPSITEILKIESFYLPAHQEIYKVMLELYANTKPVDILTVHESLRKNGHLDAIGGVNYLMDLTNKVGSAANIGFIDLYNLTRAAYGTVSVHSGHMLADFVTHAPCSFVGNT